MNSDEENKPRSGTPEYQRQWKAKHPEYHRQWRAKHPEYKERMRVYYRKIKANMTDEQKIAQREKWKLQQRAHRLKKKKEEV